jgi:4-amino-4-deoxy-L-arabinose transferase-like glycosyltransferase
MCAAWWVAGLWGSAQSQPLPPDAAHHAALARNLVLGRGYTVEWIEYHVGPHDGVRHVSELHGILRPLVLAPLFLVFGSQDAVLRIPGFSYVALTGLVAFAFARSRFGAGAGLLACGIVLGSPALARWAWMATDDSDFVFFFLCTLWLATRSLAVRPGEAGPRPRDAALAGGAAALALLAKQTGLYLPAVLAVVAWMARRRGAGAGFAAALFAPIAFAFGAYALRNLAAHGGLGFQLGPLSWIVKDQGIDAFYRIYAIPPTLGGVLAELGPARIAEIALEQFQRFGSAVLLPRQERDASLRLLALGLPSLLLQLRRDRDFAVPALAAALGGIVFLCGFYAMEKRYFLMLIPLSAVSIGGLVATTSSSVGSSRWRRLARGASALAALAIVVWSVIFGVRLALGRAVVAADHRRVCPGAVAWLRATLADDARILTHNPSWVTWVTGRAAVAMPGGGAGALAEVARHYGAEWAIVMPIWGREAAVARTERMLKRAPELAAQAAFATSRCTVYRVGAGGASGAPRGRSEKAASRGPLRSRRRLPSGRAASRSKARSSAAIGASRPAAGTGASAATSASAWWKTMVVKPRAASSRTASGLGRLAASVWSRRVSGR